MLCVGFDLRWQDENLLEVILSRNSSSEQVHYNVRLLEIETAMAYSIAFDEDWYGLPVLKRAVMIAGRLGRQWLQSLQEEEIASKSKVGVTNV